ncbi:hypothetical protein BLNAU_22717 [Blattamonas nauphoetae]|uniref:Uncharacterized protein n=1 Tax=Blattamonas nauphoetae TaxID=2049346 RepID=A0ABQ9WS93_9EUKA|nr:hypothetical protein BLNAU_22717 [Blattamonas nauphoetae]
MGNFLNKTATSSSPARSDCSRFQNWSEEQLDTEQGKAVVFRSLVATVKLQSAFDDSLEAKALKFLESVNPYDGLSTDAFLTSLGQTPDESLKIFMQSIVVLISSASQAIINASMEMLENLFLNCSSKIRLSLVQARLIPRLIRAFNPLSLSQIKTVEIHIFLLKFIKFSLWLSTPNGLEIEVRNELHAVHEAVLKQVLTPSDKYISHLCVHRFSIIDGDLCTVFLELLAQLLRICPYYQPTLNFVGHMPVVLTMPSYLTFIEKDASISFFLCAMIDAQREWNARRGEVRQMWKTVHRTLRMEGIEDVIEEKLRNDRNAYFGRYIVAESIKWSNLLGVNLPDLA